MSKTTHNHSRTSRLARFNMSKTIAVLAFVLLGTSLVAQANPGDGIEKSHFGVLLTGTTAVSGVSQPLAAGAITTTDYAALPNYYEQSKTIKNIVTLSLKEETPFFLSSNFTVTVRVKIQYGTSSSSLNTLPDQDLTISYNMAAGGKYDARKYFSMDGAAYVKVTIVSISSTTFPAGIGVENVVQVENEMRVTRFYQMTALLAPLTFLQSSTGTTADELAVEWSWPANAGNNYTQLEWAWLETELAGQYKVGGVVDPPLLFKNNSTRLDLPLNITSYKIPLLYDGTGLLYYRVRAVNIREAGSRTDGNWTTPLTYSFAGHSSLLNWEARTSFAEEGKRKTVMQYYDGSLRSRQTVTKDNVTSTVVTSETFYDEEGRPAIQILPAPGMGRILQYTKNLNHFNGQANDADPVLSFDLYPVGTSPYATPALATDTGTSRYYSPQNNDPDKNPYIPDAYGYPYSVTRYTPDATGRIMTESGVGPAFKMGSGHETKYYYGSPSQEELDGLFGTDVGYKSHYFKNMVRDANGQLSVSYVDMHGRTIATALAGDSTVGINALDITNAAMYPSQAGHSVTRNLVDNLTNSVKGNSIESITALLVSADNTIYHFNYQLAAQALQLVNCTGGPICYDCSYNLEISVTDDEGILEPTVRKFNNLHPSFNTDCNTALQPFVNDSIAAALLTTIGTNTIDFNDTLNIGSYTIRKTLTINESALQIAKDQYASISSCLNVQELTDSIYNVLITTSNCANPPTTAAACASCYSALGVDYNAYRTTYLGSIGNPVPDSALERQMRANYANALTTCKMICDTSSAVTSSLRQRMIADMIPFSGQYARSYVPVAADTLAMYNKYNIFSTFTPATQPFYRKPWKPNSTTGFYLTALGDTDRVIHPAGNLNGILDNASKFDFEQSFQYSWANQLLPHHPEYAKLLFVEGLPDGVYSWINNFLNTSTYSAAQSAGYIITTSATNDPFFVSQPSVKTNMEGKVSVDYYGGLSMWRIAVGSVKCANDPTNPSGNTACYLGYPAVPPAGGYAGLTTAENNAVWERFKALYGSVRDSMLNAFINSSVATPSAADQAALTNTGYLLHFTKSQQQQAANLHWNWLPASIATPPDTSAAANPTVPLNPATQTACSGYIEQWKLALMQCPAIMAFDSTTRRIMLDTTVNRMIRVCNKGTSNVSPNGASTVNPTTPVDGSPRSFQEVIEGVFSAYGIAKGTYCNPFVIEWPKPYGTGQRLTANPPIAVLDSCTCTRFAQLKAAAVSAGYSSSSLASLNAYFTVTYQDTITTELYNVMSTKCSIIVDSTCTITYVDQGKPCDGSTPTVHQIYYHDFKSKTHPHPYLDPPPGLDALLTNNGWTNDTGVWADFPDNGGSYAIGLASSSPASVRMNLALSVAPGNKLTLTKFEWYDRTIKDGYKNYNLSVINGTTTSLWNGNVFWAASPASPMVHDGINTFPTALGNLTGNVTVRVTLTGRAITTPDFKFDNFALYGYVDPLTYSCPVPTCTIKYKTYPLPSPQPFPSFMQCGYVPKNCLNCAQISSLTDSFKLYFNTFPTATAPLFTNVTLDSAQAEYNSNFARYLNFKTGFNYTWTQYAQAALAATCNLAAYATNIDSLENVICVNPKTLTDTTGLFVLDPPCQRVKDVSAALAVQIYQQRQEWKLAAMESAYRAKCLGAKDLEVFTVQYTNKEYHYTLYYYDQAGNLVKTVPPKGVVPNYTTAFLNAVQAQRDAGLADTPSHFLATQYRYNSLNQVVKQKTPDAWISAFWYDKLGRLAVSRNEQQLADGKYSYTIYDLLGRINEVGQKPQTTAMTQTISQDPIALSNWMVTTGGTREQITRTTYDFTYSNAGVPILPAALLVQKNLRNRISYSMVFDSDPGATLGLQQSATFYTYDVQGNVDTLVQDFKGLSFMSGGNQYKRICYDFDLVSGKVTEVHYQPNETDAFYHKYNYDGENRLTQVYTSRDRIYWEKDANYSYYKHGPLARTVLGQMQVQGMDYAYTLQGWLKGVNTTQIADGTYDMGHDGQIGSVNQLVARDAVGFGLHYYDNTTTQDYNPISAVSLPFARPNNAAFDQLFNGNIAGVAINNAGLILDPNNYSDPFFYKYRYDQLNRLKWMQPYKGLNSNNSWTPTILPDYREIIKYDPNGNILNYSRNGTTKNGQTLQMDELTYNYNTSTNRVNFVDDNFSSSYLEDIDDQTSGNYVYDKIGNLIQDNTPLKQIGATWNVYGKISTILNPYGTGCRYNYDAMGNRQSRTSTSGATNATVYVRDKSGNASEVYDFSNSVLNLSETSLDGITHFGTLTALTVAPSNITLLSGFGMAKISTFTRGEKRFEIQNQTFNTINIVTDRKIGHNLSGNVDFYYCDIKEANEYYAYGMAMPAKHFANGYAHRYNYNSQEFSPEIDPFANSYHAQFWQYDSRLGMRWNIDPATLGVPDVSPYATFNSNPILHADVFGAQPDNVIITGKDGKKWTVTAPGKDVYFKVPVDLKQNKVLNLGLSYLADGERYAVGYTISAGANVSVGSGAGASLDFSVVNFTNRTYGGYSYSYAGAGYNGSVGVQEGVSAYVGVNVLVAINTNNQLNSVNTNPKTFAGETKSFGISQDLKAAVGGGWNLSGFSMSDWIGVSFGISAGVGESANAGSLHAGISNSILLNDVKPTRSRGFFDIAFNVAFPISSGVVDYAKRMLQAASSLTKLTSTTDDKKPIE